MMNKKVWMIALASVLLVIASLGLAGCGQKPASQGSGKSDLPASGAAGAKEPGKPAGPPGMEGYVVQKEGGRILVVDSVPKDYSSTGGVKEFYNAIFFSGAPDDIRIGQKVKVWFTIVAESYPGQSKAEHVEVLPDVRPEGASLTEAEAIAKALESEQAKKDWPKVKNAAYDPQAHIWTVNLKQNDKDVSIQIQDH